MRKFINTKNIPAIDELKIDVNKDKPSMHVEVDREKAGELGVSAGQVGQQLRNSIFGAKAGVYKEGGEDYDIYVRFNEDSRYNSSVLFNQTLTFRNNKGQLREIPIVCGNLAKAIILDLVRLSTEIHVGWLQFTRL